MTRSRPERTGRGRAAGTADEDVEGVVTIGTRTVESAKEARIGVGPGRVKGGREKADPLDMQVLDRGFLLDNVDGDRELLAEIVETFRSTSPEMLEGIRRATAAADSDSVHRGAHQLKGALAAIGAEAASAAAATLEGLGQRGEIVSSAAAPALDALEREMLRLAPELDALVTPEA